MTLGNATSVAQVSERLARTGLVRQARYDTITVVKGRIMIIHRGNGSKAKCGKCGKETVLLTTEEAREADRIHKMVFHR